MYCVYWIRRINHTDPLNEGYIGVSNNLSKRLNAHKKSTYRVGKAIRKYEDIVSDVLYSNLSEECALQIEAMYRPEEDIGWNHAKGGGKPPLCKPGIKRSNEWLKKVTKINQQRYKSGVGLAAWNGSDDQKKHLKKIYADRIITWGDKISATKKQNPWPAGNPMSSEISRQKVSASKVGTKALYKENQRKMAVPDSPKWNALVAEGWKFK